MSWAPDASTLAQLASLLEQSNSHALSQADRTSANQQLDQVKAKPDFNKYLTYMLVTPDSNHALRATAGLVLKNNLGADTEYIQQNIITGLSDDVELIRNISAITLTTLLSRVGLANWPGLLESLVEMSQSSSPQSQHGAMSALVKVCEDHAQLLDMPLPNGQRPLDALVPRFIEECKSQDEKLRANAVFCLTQFIPLESQSFLIHINEFMNALFTLAQDPFPETRRNIAVAFNSLLTSRADKLAPHLDGIISFCLHCMNDEAEEVALEGAEFILTLAECFDVPDSAIEPQLPKIVPVILEKLVYSDLDIMILESLDEDDCQVEDKQTDIRPVNVPSKQGHGRKPQQTQQSEDDDEDDDDLEASLEDWNLRKCSGACLDILTTRLGATVLHTALPHLRKSIADKSWPVCESAVLAFGAVATGCIQTDTLDFLPELVPYLTELLANEHAPIRDMCCWTLGRYASLIVENQQWLQGVIQGMLRCGLDNNKKVQKSGCHALSVISEPAGDLLIPYTEILLEFFRQCFQKYQLGNMMALFECIQSVVTAVSYTINNPVYLPIILNPLLQKWETYGDEDRHVLPLLECLSAIATYAGDAFQPYAESLFTRATDIMKTNLIMHERFRQDPSNCEAPELEFLICALDLISGIIQGLRQNVRPLIARVSDPTLLEMIQVCMTNEVPEVHVSAFAVIGDLAAFAFDDLRPALDQILRGLIANIDSQDARFNPVYHNAIWASGEMAVQMGAEMEPYFPDIFQRLGTVLMSPTAAVFLRENAALAIGRLGISLSHLVSPHLGVLFDRWVQSLTYVDESLEKDTAYQGLCHVVASNHMALNEHQLGRLLIAFAHFYEPSPELKELVVKVLEGYKATVPTFDQILASAGSDTQRQLSAVYGI